MADSASLVWLACTVALATAVLLVDAPQTALFVAVSSVAFVVLAALVEATESNPRAARDWEHRF